MKSSITLPHMRESYRKISQADFSLALIKLPVFVFCLTKFKVKKKKIDFKKYPSFGMLKDDPRTDEEILSARRL